MWGFEVIKGFNKKEDKERQIRPILARQVWLNESAAPVVPCGRDLTLAVAFVEKKLTKREQKDFQSHLIECRHCRQFVSSEVRLQRPVFESPAVVAASRESFFTRLKFQWVTVAAGLVLAAGMTSLLLVNHNSGLRQASNPLNNNVSAPMVATAEPGPAAPATSPRPNRQRDAVAAVTLDGNAVTGSPRTSIDLGGIAGAGTASSATTGTAPNTPVANATTNPDVKKDLPENSFKVDGSAVSPVASMTTAVNNPPVPVTDDKVSEFRLSVEPKGLDAKPDTPAPTRTTELKTELISMSLSDLDQASVNVAGSGNGFVRRDSEVVIMSRPLVPWTTSLSGKPIGPRPEELISKRSPYNTQTRVAFAGKLFNQVDKVWIDQEFTASANLPVVKVKVKSQQGQEVLAANPGLKPFFSMHKQIVVVYEGKVYMTY